MESNKPKFIKLKPARELLILTDHCKGKSAKLSQDRILPAVGLIGSELLPIAIRMREKFCEELFLTVQAYADKTVLVFNHNGLKVEFKNSFKISETNTDLLLKFERALEERQSCINNEVVQKTNNKSTNQSIPMYN